MGRFSGKLAVVTGASRGIGYQTALALGREGAHVIALARTVGGLEDLDDAIRSAGGEAATLVPLDLTDFDAIDRLGAAIYERWGRLDVLIGNAGSLGVLTPVGHMKVKEFDTILSVNVTANWRLLRSLDPLLRASERGRAVFITSGAAHSCKPFWGPYAASKAALEALVRVYAAENASTPVRANLFNPGPVRTAMRAKAYPGEDPATLTPPAEVTEAIIAMALPEFTSNGAIYDFPTKSILTPKMPA